MKYLKLFENYSTMDKDKMIKFLSFIGITDNELTSIINETRFDLTDVILKLVSDKIGESVETLTKWYSKFKVNKDLETAKEYIDKGEFEKAKSLLTSAERLELAQEYMDKGEYKKANAMLRSTEELRSELDQVLKTKKDAEETLKKLKK